MQRQLDFCKANGLRILSSIIRSCTEDILLFIADIFERISTAHPSLKLFVTQSGIIKHLHYLFSIENENLRQITITICMNLASKYAGNGGIILI